MITTRSGMNKNTFWRRSRGVSFIEVLLAMAILSALMIPVMISFGASSSGIQMTSEELIAHTAAMELLEQTMAVPFDILPIGSFSGNQINAGQKIDETQSPLRYHISPTPDLAIVRSLKVTPLIKDNKTRFKKVDVEVTWVSRDGKNKRNVTLKGLIANEEN